MGIAPQNRNGELMLSPVMMTTIGSVFLGFFLFTGAFASYSYKKPQALTWTLFALAVLFVTLIPVTLALIIA